METIKKTCDGLGVEFGVPLWYFSLEMKCVYYFSTGPSEMQTFQTLTKELIHVGMKKKGPPMILYEDHDTLIYMGGGYDIVSKARKMFSANLSPAGSASGCMSLTSVTTGVLQKETEISLKAEGATLVEDYGPHSHALFGVSDFLGKELAYYSALRRQALFSYNRSLTLRGQKCAGWIIRYKDALPEVMNFLRTLNVVVSSSSQKTKLENKNVSLI